MGHGGKIVRNGTACRLEQSECGVDKRRWFISHGRCRDVDRRDGAAILDDGHGERSQASLEFLVDEGPAVVAYAIELVAQVGLVVDRLGRQRGEVSRVEVRRQGVFIEALKCLASASSVCS